MSSSASPSPRPRRAPWSRELYTRRARESDVRVEQVGKLFATKIAETAPAGTYFRQPDGSYVRK